jgi:hypothetical protein
MKCIVAEELYIFGIHGTLSTMIQEKSVFMKQVV